MKTIQNRISNKIVVLSLLAMGLFSACKDEHYVDQFVNLTPANVDITYNAIYTPVVYDASIRDTMSFTIAKPVKFMVPSGVVYTIVPDSIAGDSVAYITKNQTALLALFKPLGLNSPNPVLYPNDAKDGNVHLDYRNILNKSDAQKAGIAYFKKGKYKVYFRVLAPNNFLSLRSSSANFEVPSISIGATSLLKTLNYTVGEAVTVEGFLKVSSDDGSRTAVTVTLDSPDFELSDNVKTSTTTAFTPMATNSKTYDVGVDIFKSPLYVRLKPGMPENTKKTGTLTITHEGQTPIILSLVGNVNPLQIRSTVTSLTGFIYLLTKGPSVAQSFVVSGDVNDKITIKAPANYEISTTAASGYLSTMTLAKTQGGNVANKTIYVRLKAGLVKGTYNESVSIESTNATTLLVSLTGEVQ